MSLDRADLSFDLAWTLLKTVTGFTNISAPDSKTFSIQLETGTYNRLYAKRHSIAAAASEDIDLSSYADLFGDTKAMTGVVAIVVIPTGTNISATLKPGATNGLVWFFGSTSDILTIPCGGLKVHYQPVHHAVDGTHKVLTVGAVGSGTLTVDILILGKS